MTTGITFITRDEAKEYADAMRRQGWITAVSYQPETKVYVVTIGTTAKKPLPEEMPMTTYEALELEAEAKEAAEEAKAKAEEEAGKRETREKVAKEIGGKAAKGIGEWGSITKGDILGSFEKQKGGAGHVKAGMVKAIPPRPYTAAHTPRIGIEGAVGVKAPRIGRIRGVGENKVYFPELKNGRIPSGARFQTPRSRLAQLTPIPKPSYPYFKSKKEREEEK